MKGDSLSAQTLFDVREYPAEKAKTEIDELVEAFSLVTNRIKRKFK